MNPVLKELLESKRVSDTNNKTYPVHSAISEQEGNALQSIIKELKPKISVEIGLAYGVSALYICDAMKQANHSNFRHIVIDPQQSKEWRSIGYSNLKKAGFERNATFYEQSSHLVLPRLEEEGLSIDFAFIDGWHTFDYAMLDFFYLDRMLKVGGVIVLDDVWMPGVKKVARYILANRNYLIYKAMEGFKESHASAFASLFYLLTRLFSSHILKVVINGRFLALEKIANDTRPWNHYREF